MEIKFTVDDSALQNAIHSARAGAHYWATFSYNDNEELVIVEREKGVNHVLKPDMLEYGVRALLDWGLFTGKAPMRYRSEIVARVVTGYADNNDGDIFLQLCLFGEIVYG